MRFLLPELNEKEDAQQDPGRWAVLPGLCCQAVGGKLESTLTISAAWMLLYIAAHIVDTIEDEDDDPRVSKLGATGVAINAANGLFLSAVLQLHSMHEQDIPQDLATEITADYLETILIMTSGQHLDLTIPQVELGQWWQIAEAKSGAFFSLACRAGARLGTSDTLKVKALSEYGFHLGILLQILDDLQEFTLLLESRKIVSPITLKKSLAAAYACDTLPDAQKNEFTRLLHADVSKKEFADKLIDILDDCGAGLYMVAEANNHFDRGMTSLDAAHPSSPFAEMLESIIRDLKLK